MRTKIALERTMKSAADALDHMRPMLLGLVERAEHRHGSRMTAYEAVARGIGASASWVRKALGRQPVGIDGHVVLNILTAYRDACERLEAEAALERARFLALGKAPDGDPVRRSMDQPMGLATSAEAPRGGPTVPVVAQAVVEADRR